LDFGLATATKDADTTLRGEAGFSVFGTPEYMAPEQGSGEAVDPRSDLYSLGCVLYEMVTGYRVFDGKSAIEVLGKQMREMPEPPRKRAPARSIAKGFERVVLRCLEKSTLRRFGSAVELREALEDVLDEPRRRRLRARNASVFLLGAAVITVLAAVAGSSLHATGPRAAVPEAQPQALSNSYAAAVPAPLQEEASEPTPVDLPLTTVILAPPQGPGGTPANKASREPRRASVRGENEAPDGGKRHGPRREGLGPKPEAR
jgi:serine/threonine-protein kinase